MFLIGDIMIVVTGACGFIGSNLIRRLIERGERNILAVDYVVRDYIKSYNVLFTPAEEFYRNIDSYNKFQKIKTIFHEGAISSTTESDKKLLCLRNIIPSLKLMYYCRDNQIPLQYASSASVYGNLSKIEWENKNKKESPLNLYAKSKFEIDYVLDLISKSKNPPKLIQGMRYFNVYGTNEDHKGNQSSPYNKFEFQLKETGKIKLFKNSQNYFRDFISVDEVIDLKFIALDYCKSGIYDIGTSRPKSFYSVALEICEKYKMDPNESIEFIDIPENIEKHYQQYSKANMDWVKSFYKERRQH